MGRHGVVQSHTLGTVPPLTKSGVRHASQRLRNTRFVLTLTGVLVLAVVAGSACGSARQARHQWLAYVRSGDVYVLDPATGTTLRLTRGRKAQANWGPHTDDLAVSPDETKVAFTGMTRRGAAIFVRPIRGSGRALDVTPWRGLNISLSPRSLDPQWLDSSHIVYTADESGSKPAGVVMALDLKTGRFRPLPGSRIPGGAEFRFPTSIGHPPRWRAGVMQPLLINRRFAAYQRFNFFSSGCAATSDVVRGTGTHKTMLTDTRPMDEDPLDLTPGGRVLARRVWISKGPHEGLCVSAFSTNTFRQELIALARPRRVDVLVRFAPLVLKGADLPAVDAAWSPDGRQLAFISPRGDLIIRSLRERSQRVVAHHVEALDW